MRISQARRILERRRQWLVARAAIRASIAKAADLDQQEAQALAVAIQALEAIQRRKGVKQG